MKENPKDLCKQLMNEINHKPKIYSTTSTNCINSLPRFLWRCELLWVTFGVELVRDRVTSSEKSTSLFSSRERVVCYLVLGQLLK